MPFPFALVSQGIGLAFQLFGSGSSGISAQAQLEIVRQLGVVNSNLLTQTGVLKEILDVLQKFHHSGDVYKSRTDVAVLNEKLSDQFEVLERGDDKDLEDVYQELQGIFKSYRDSLDRLEVILGDSRKYEFSLVDLSFPIMASINNILLLATYMYFPSGLAKVANSDASNVKEPISLAPVLSRAKYQAIIADIHGILEQIVHAENGHYRNFQAQLRNRIKKHSSSAELPPSTIVVKCLGLRQQRYKGAVHRLSRSAFPFSSVNNGIMDHLVFFDFWMNKPFQVEASIAVNADILEVSKDFSHTSSSPTVTRSGGTAKNWRNSYNDQAGHKTGRLPAKPYKHKLKSKKQWFKEFKDGVHNDLPASIAKVRATADQRFIFKKALEHLHSINNEDFEAAKEHKEFLADIDKIEELIGVWLYMENFLDAVTEMKDELEARLLGWEGKIDV